MPFLRSLVVKCGKIKDIHKHLVTWPYQNIIFMDVRLMQMNQVDTVYISASGSIHGTGQSLFRYQISDVNSPWTDKIDRVAIYWGAPSG